MSPWEYVLPLYKHAVEKWETSERRATYGNDHEVAGNMSIKSSIRDLLSHLFGVSSALKSSRWSLKLL